MHIGLITGSFLPSVGGIEWKTHYLAEEYIRRGHEATVFTSRPGLSLAPVTLPVSSSYQVIRSGLPFPGSGVTGLTPMLIKQAVLRFHRQKPLDALHCHHLAHPTAIGVDVKRKIALPVLATPCGIDLQILPELRYGVRLARRYDKMVRRNLARIDRISSINSSIHDLIIELAPGTRPVAIPNGVAWDDFQSGPSTWLQDKLDLSPEKKIVLSIGRNNPIKGYRYSIEAFASVVEQCDQCYYVIVGRDVTSLSPLVNQLNLNRHVRLIESTPITELPAIFHSADIYLSSSLLEGFPQVVAQAMASGLPSVLTDVPGNRDAAASGSALLAPAKDPAAMANEIIKLLQNDTLRGDLAKTAHQASIRYSWRVIADEYLQIIQSMVGSS